MLCGEVISAWANPGFKSFDFIVETLVGKESSHLKG